MFLKLILTTEKLRLLFQSYKILFFSIENSQQLGLLYICLRFNTIQKAEFQRKNPQKLNESFSKLVITNIDEIGPTTTLSQGKFKLI